MKIIVENLGTIRYGELELGNFTVLCGKNNSGKTYVTYALYGFIDFWKKKYELKIPNDIINDLKNHGVANINLNDFLEKAQDIILKACEEYTEIIADVYSAQKKLFENTTFKIIVDNNEVEVLNDEYHRAIKTTKTNSEMMILQKEKQSVNLTTTLFADNSNVNIPDFLIIHTLNETIKHLVFSSIFPNCFIASAERTGAAIFRQELNFARNKLLNKVIKNDMYVNPIELIKNEKADYALPVEHNVEFTRNLELCSKNNSFIMTEHIEVLEKFQDILGGSYNVDKNGELSFQPQKGNTKLSMDESSSAVRSLLDIVFYLKHEAKPNDMLIIDEPELNLHPENQRKIARLLSTLINFKLKIFITTHSDYILRELSNLILLNSEKPHIEKLRKNEDYSTIELLNVNDIKVYVSERSKIKLNGSTRVSNIQTLTKTPINAEDGIQLSCFDSTIEIMNKIQDEILYGG